MPPRHAPSTNRQDYTSGGGRGLPPPPPPKTQLLESLRFRRLNPKEFGGTTDPFLAEGWIRSLKLHFHYLEMRDGDWVRCDTYMLRDDTSIWWEEDAHGVYLATLTWSHFKDIFYNKYFPANVRGCLTREFMILQKVDSFVAEFIRKFYSGSHFVALIARDAAQMLRHFIDGL
ncbi:uncharacterized protein LOC142550103 [Primulina tabacum]|uniref:uncharacterized protein LOC142550103 n=1 Tax=Primulina tabacum TaxID=48773 RepID=UPI003F5A7533